MTGPRVGVLAVMLAVMLATLAGGWLWGAAGRADLERALRSARVQGDLLEARAALLAARVNLCDADFQGVSRHLESARAFVALADARPQTAEVAMELRRLDLAGFRLEIDQARRLAAVLARGAGASAPLQ